MPAIETICTITAKGQTTVPKSIRQALGVGAGGRIAFRVEDGVVSVRAAERDEPDQALGPFLALLEADMIRRPAQILPLDEAMLTRLNKALDGVTVDPDDPIEGDVSL
jgi:antitoxin PrlF